MVTANLSLPAEAVAGFCAAEAHEKQRSLDKRQVDIMVLINCNKYCPNEGKKHGMLFLLALSVAFFFITYPFLIVWYSNSATLAVPTLFMASS